MLPKNVQAMLLSFMNSAKLSFAAIDLIVTPDNDYVFLEANPDGQYLWIEGITGAPISKAIARTLSEPPKTPMLNPVQYLTSVRNK